MMRLFKFAAVSSWIILSVLSLAPGEDRPHTGYSGNAEHILAYFLAAAATKIAFLQIKGIYQLCAFSAASAFFEICQIWIPGRSAGVDNWAASSAGALAGIAAIVFLGRVIRASSADSSDRVSPTDRHKRQSM